MGTLLPISIFMNKKCFCLLIVSLLASCSQEPSNVRFSVINGQRIEAVQEKVSCSGKEKEHSKEDFLNMVHMAYEKTYSLEVENTIKDNITATIQLLDNEYEPIFKFEYDNGWYKDPLGEFFICDYSDNVLTIPDLEYDYRYLYLKYGFTEQGKGLYDSKTIYWEVIIYNQLEN